MMECGVQLPVDICLSICVCLCVFVCFCVSVCDDAPVVLVITAKGGGDTNAPGYLVLWA